MRKLIALPMATALAIAALSLTVGPTSTADAATGTCTATLTMTNSWPGNYQAEVTVTAGATPITQWTVAIPLGSSTVSGAWNSTLAAGATGNATASNLAYNGSLAAGGSTGFGFQGTGTVPASVTCSAGGTGTDPTPDPTPDPTTGAPTDDDWLHVSGSTIVDSEGNAVWLTGANWFGFNATERVFHGLWSVNMDSTMQGIAEHGINVLRVPISTELLKEWKNGQAAVPSGVNTYANPELTGLTTLEVFDAFLAQSKKYGVKVILDVHSAEADNSGHIAPMWYKGSMTTQDFYDTWVWVADRYKNDDTIIGFDLENEPHGAFDATPRAKWDGTTDADNWKYVAQTAANKILAANPNVLILVEGIETYPKEGKSWTSTNKDDYYSNWWGGNLRGVADFPIDLGANQDQLVYSPHDYGPLVFEQEWFSGTFTQGSLTTDVWTPNWLYIHDSDTAPLLIGEWGGRVGQDDRQDAWMTYLRNVIVEKKLHYTFWCINPNSGDTGGLLLDDWATWDAQKLALLDAALWQDSNGKFVSIDHVVKLPGGTNVTEYYANRNAAPIG